MKKALMISAVVLVSAVLWGEEPAAPQTTEQPKEEASPAQKEEPAMPAPEVPEKKDEGEIVSEKTEKTEEKAEPVVEKKEEKVEEDTRSFWEIAFSTDERKKKGEKEKKFFFGANFNFVWMSGNQIPFADDYMRVGFNLSSRWDNNITKVIVSHQELFSTAVDKSLDDSKKYEINKDGLLIHSQMAASGDFQLHVDHYIANRWELFFFSDTERNPYERNLNMRFSTGAGTKFVLFRNKYWWFDIGVAPVFELTSYVGLKLLREFRASGRARIGFVLYEFIELGGKVYYIPNILSFPGDYRYKVESYLRFNYFLDDEKEQSIVVGFTYNRDYNSNPSPGTYTASPNRTVQKLDQSVLTTIGVNF